MPTRKGLLAPQNTFLDTIATRFDGTHSNFVLGNAQAHNGPIVYCSDGFCDLSGFGRAQVMAKSCCCRFLYGPDTDEKEKERLGDAIKNKNELKCEIMLYTKNGSPFWCLLDIVPIKNEKSQVVLFLVSHKNVSREKASTGTIIDDGTATDDYSSRVGIHEKRDREDFRSQRRRSRAVLYHLSGQFDKQDKTKSKLQHLNKLQSLGDKRLPDYKVQDINKSRWIIFHYGIFKIGWDWLILLCTYYIAFMVPFNAAFITRDGLTRTSIYADVIVEVLFIIDIVLNFCTSFVSSTGQVVYEPRQIALNYLKSWFFLDLLAAIPFDLLYVFEVDTNTYIHLLKTARLLRLARLFQRLERYTQYGAVVLTILMCMFTLLAHWLACIWYVIGKEEMQMNPANWSVGWLYELGERTEQIIYNRTNIPDNIKSYVSALYFTCSSLTSVGFGNVSANTNYEKIFSICMMLIGALMHAVIFGNVTAIIQQMYARRSTYDSKLNDLKDFFRAHHIPKNIVQKMQEYFQTVWSVNNGIDTTEILKDFPEEMRGDIGMHLYKEILSLPIFETATQGCLKSISLQIRKNFCAPGEYLVHKGDAINYVYFMCSGSMEILKTDMVVAILGKGDLFGVDINFTEPIVMSSCDVKALTYCELQCLNIRALVDILSLYPDFAERFAVDIQHDLTYNVKEGYDAEECDANGGPVVTLPSISEDEEQQLSDKENTPDDDDVTNKIHFSPLLTRSRSTTQLPNGHIEEMTSFPSYTRSRNNFSKWRRVRNRMDVKEEAPLAKRPPGDLRRTSSTGSRLLQYKRHPQRDSKRHQIHSSPSKANLLKKKAQSDDSLFTQTLKMEIEATRSTVDSLEKRMGAMCRDISAIGANVDQLVRALASFSGIPTERPTTNQTMSSRLETHGESLQSNVREAPTKNKGRNNGNAYNEHHAVSPEYSRRSQSLSKPANEMKTNYSSESIEAGYLSCGDSGISLKHLAQSGNINDQIPYTQSTTMDSSDHELYRTSIHAPTRLEIVEDGVILETTDL